MKNNPLSLLYFGLFLIVLSGLPVARAGDNQWTGIGPDGGTNITDLVATPSTPETLYAVVNINKPDASSPVDRVYKTTNSGKSLQATGSGPSTGWDILSLSLDPSNPDTLYALAITNSGNFRLPNLHTGIYKSADSGGNWTLVGTQLPPGLDNGKTSTDPSNPSIRYELTNGILYQSIDNGEHSTALNPSAGSTVLGFLIAPTNPSTLWVRTASSVYKSLDSGGSWVAANTGLTALSVKYLALAPSQPNTLYAGAGDQLVKSADGGRNWNTDKLNLPSGATPQAIAFDPSDPNTQYAATGDKVYKSIDGGGNWSLASTGLNSGHAIISLTADRSNPATLYAGTWNELYKSIDGGGNWNLVSSWVIYGLPIYTNSTLGVNLIVDPSDFNRLYRIEWGAAYKGLGGIEPWCNFYQSNDGGNRWDKATLNLPNGEPVQSLAYDPYRSSILYAGTTGKVYKSTDAGGQWNAVGTGSPAWTETRALAVDPNNPNTLYAGTETGGAFKFTSAYILNIAKSGNGIGTATSNPPGISCGSGCGESYDIGAVVMLTASADPSSDFAGWVGDAECAKGQVTMSQSHTCTAIFNLKPVPLAVSLSGSGTGIVSSQPSGIVCGGDCSESFAHGTSVKLTATPANGSSFTGWGGSCSGTGACQVTLNKASSVTAYFTANQSADTECLFGWAEKHYPALFAPSLPYTKVLHPYTYRYYAATNAYLGVSSIDHHVYYLGPDRMMRDEGPLADWLPKIGCKPPPQYECLFNWLEGHYASLFTPSGVVTEFWEQFTFRHYSATNTFLGISSTDNKVYYRGPDGKLSGQGPLTLWLSKAGCQ